MPARKTTRRYGKAATKSVQSAMRKRKRGALKSGRGGKGGTVKSRKQAIAIGLSEAREQGAKVPRKRSVSKKTTRKTTARKGAARKRTTRKTTTRKTTTRKSTRKRSR
jgi:hypothetical protein